MKDNVRQRMAKSKDRIQKRLRKERWKDQKRRFFRDQNIHYDFAEKTRAGRFGGLGPAC